MPLAYKINIIDELKYAGYSSYRIRKEKLLSEGALQRLRDGRMISTESIEIICRLLDCQPGDLIKYTKEGE